MWVKRLYIPNNFALHGIGINGFVQYVLGWAYDNAVVQREIVPDGSTLPPDGQVGGQVNLYYHLEDFKNAFAVLSEEKLVYLLYSGSGPGFQNGIQTSAEPLGNVT